MKISKFDKLFEATMADYLKAGTKAALKAPFKGLGYIAKKAIDPRTYLQGAAALAGGAGAALTAPGKAVNALKQGLVYGPGSSGDPSQLVGSVAGGIQKGLGAAEKGITKGIQGVKSSVQTQLQKDLNKKLYGTSDLTKQTQTFDISYLTNNMNRYRGNKPPQRLAKGDTFAIVDRTGRVTPYETMQNKNGILMALPSLKK